jgi:2-hydroxychromene-2-carboxylate isomerase
MTGRGADRRTGICYVWEMARALDFHFDFVSPYSYLAWTQIHALAERAGRAVRPRPTLFAGLLASSGGRGPAEIPLKRVYIFKDVVRNARVLGVPLAPPPTHPFNPLVALRVAGLPMPDDVARRVIDALFHAAWGSGQGVETPEQVARALTGVVPDPAATIAAAGEPAAKAALRATTDLAIAAGVFGVPTVLADGEMFWGCDSLPHLARFLAGEDTLTAADVERFLAVRASATRS